MRDQAPILILDGGLGTTLEEKHHIRFSSAETPLWSSHLLLTDQRTLLACHEDFAAAGADVISTATYQASIAGFANTRTPDWSRGVPLNRVPEFLEDAVAIARSAGAGRVALSLGPYGATVVPSQEYGGEYDEEHCGVSALMAWHLERFGLFAKVPGLFERVDYVAFETVPRLDEVMAIRRMMDDNGLYLGVPHWISCVFPGDDEVLALPDGTPVEEAVRAMLSGEVADVVPWGIGINCTKVTKLSALVERYEHVVRGMVDSGELSGWPSLVLYPDGTNGEVYNTATQKWEIPDGKEAPKQSWESQVAEVVKATQGRSRWNTIVVGGCCKTSPEDITRLRAEVPPRNDIGD
ncbi:homocysteine S-methyltransferase [Coniochaeta ligniaria NRRL 30616]|uniref:Homocysteine S-methyltransferase n=1 Tax=Coniochaeta ligniaria NRRL 30616 TaxID=1408157 RepID=A0A1J7JW74_9PEZI|nr:homocysteine S-methyltransferase [Coniochaeta ligniaria NRRL 30616]